MPDIMTLKEWSVRTARLMVGIPDYQTYVEHRRQTHPGEPIMTYEISSWSARTLATQSAKAASAPAVEPKIPYPG